MKNIRYELLRQSVTTTEKRGLVRLSEQCFPSSSYKPNVSSTEGYWDAQLRLLSSSSHGLYAVYMGEVVGVGLYKLVSKKYNLWELYHIGVLEEFRGRGIATSVVRSIIGKISSLGGVRVYLSVDEDNEPAIRSYRRNGFQELFSFVHFKLSSAESFSGTPLVQPLGKLGNFEVLGRRQYRVFWMLFRHHYRKLSDFMGYCEKTFHDMSSTDNFPKGYSPLSYLYYKENQPCHALVNGWVDHQNHTAYITELISVNLQTTDWQTFFQECLSYLHEIGVNDVSIRVNTKLGDYYDLISYSSREQGYEVVEVSKTKVMMGNKQLT